MRRRVVYLLIIVLVVLALVFLPRVVSAGGFLRGDTDASGAVGITDPLRVLLFLFAGAPGVVT